MRVVILAVFMTFCAVPNVQAQPVSWGMAQCSALMTVMEAHVTQEPHKEYLADASQSLFQAAVLQAHAEGRDPAELGAVKAVKRDEWVAMGYSMAFRTEFRDWTDYCKSLARSHGVALDRSILN